MSRSKRNFPQGRPARRLLISFCAGLAAAGVVNLLLHASMGDPTAEERREFERALRDANDHLLAERYLEALEEFRKASGLVPSDPRPHDGMGNVYHNLLLDERASEAFRDALDRDPGYQPSLRSLSMLLYEFGKNSEALALLKRAEEQAPDDPFFWGEIALNEIRLGNPGRAIPLLERYVSARSTDAWGHANLARACAEADRPVEAERSYREALRINPRMSIACLWLGQLLISTGRKAEAQPFLAKFQELRGYETQEHNLKMALLRGPDHVPTLVQLARVRYLLGKHREAVSTFERAIRLAPGDSKLRHLYEEMIRSLERKAGGE